MQKILVLGMKWVVNNGTLLILFYVLPRDIKPKERFDKQDNNTQMLRNQGVPWESELYVLGK